ncbi:MAG: hypothetical protein EA421_04335 [Gemmatimonadales bacterium]|nr:MAG: hypothetical protein EA421_04335 [Gemmatimonadales bacterium]
MRLRRAVPFFLVAIIVAACSSDLPTTPGLISAEDSALMQTDPVIYGVDICKTWLGADPVPDIDWEFEWTATSTPTSGSTTIFPGDFDGGTMACIPLGSWPAGTEVTVTELVPEGYFLALTALRPRDGSDSVIFSDPESPSLTFLVDTYNTVFFKNTPSDALPLEVEKTAAGTYDRTVDWELTKSVSPSSHMGAPGDEFVSDWTVTATKSEISGNYAVTGTITVTNPNGFDVAFTLADVLDDGTVANITCPVTDDNTGTAPAGGSVTCDYSAAPADASATLNTATATFDVGAGSTTATATAGVTFTENLIGDDEVTLSDPRVDYSMLISGTTTEIFPETFTCPADPSQYTDGVYTQTFTNTAFLNGDNTDLEASAEVTIKCELPPAGEGCTPGFWRQPHHFDQWVGYAPGDSYAAVFGVDRDGSLIDNVTARGGGENALARHSVAALLNAASPDVDYDLTVDEVIAAVQDAFASGDFEAIKDRLEGFNEQGCPL